MFQKIPTRAWKTQPALSVVHKDSLSHFLRIIELLQLVPTKAIKAAVEPANAEK